MKNDLDLLDQIVVETSYKTLLVHHYLVRELSHYRNVKENARHHLAYLIQQELSIFVIVRHHLQNTYFNKVTLNSLPFVIIEFSYEGVYLF